jgi:hypothetical protein
MCDPGPNALFPFCSEGWESRLHDSPGEGDEFIANVSIEDCTHFKFLAWDSGSECRAETDEGSTERSTFGRRVLTTARHKARHDTVITICTRIIIKYLVLSCSAGRCNRDEGGSRAGNDSVVELHRDMVVPTILERHAIASSRELESPHRERTVLHVFKQF